MKRADPELERIIDLMLRRVAGPQHRAENIDRDRWLALDRETRIGDNLDERVGEDWADLLGPNAARQVAVIASRMRQHAEFQQVLRDVDRAALLLLVQQNYERLMCIEKWRRRLQFAGPT